MQHTTTNQPDLFTAFREVYQRYFFTGMALISIGVTVFGFGTDYQLIFKENIGIAWFVHVHGLILFSWLALFFLQSTLVLRHNLKLHRKIGTYSVIIGTLSFLSMGVVIFHAHIGFPVHTSISWASVLYLSLTLLLFGLFFTWGIIKRSIPADHKRLFLLATLIAITAGFNRTVSYFGIGPTCTWKALPILSKSSILGVPNPSAWLLLNDLLLIPLILYDLLILKRFHKKTIAGIAIILVVELIIIITWPLLT